VRWFVLKSPNTASLGEITTFARLYSMNARPTEPLNGRQVLASK
jgi:carbonic anhydrase